MTVVLSRAKTERLSALGSILQSLLCQIIPPVEDREETLKLRDAALDGVLKEIAVVFKAGSVE